MKYRPDRIALPAVLALATLTTGCASDSVWNDGLSAHDYQVIHGYLPPDDAVTAPAPTPGASPAPAAAPVPAGEAAPAPAIAPAPVGAAPSNNAAGLPLYQDTTADFETRARDLVSRMTLEEKSLQVGHNAPAIPRLGVPEYNWWNEGLHGVARAGIATVFPQAIGLAASWDRARMHETAVITSDEFRAKYLATLHDNGGSGFYQGLTVWSPNINIFRDPRWGRGQETYGEDPYLTGEIATAFITGLQGDDPKYYKVIATSKHFAVHSGPELTRHRQDMHPSAKDLEETYLAAFRKTVVDAHVAAVMCAYNALDGVPACANEFLMGQKLRHDWGFKGYVVSDCGAVANIYRDDALAYEADRVKGVALAFKAGMDVICGDYRNNLSTEPDQIVEGVKNGALPVDVLDRALIRLFSARMKLGMFDPYASLPFANITKADFDTPEHRAASLAMAKELMVLLKNDGDLLPLKGAPGRIAVIGPNADSFDTLVGNYYGTPSDPVTVLDGLKARFPTSKIDYVQGTGLVGAPEIDMDPAMLCVDVACTKQGLTAEHFDNKDLTGKPSSTAIEARPYVQWRSSDTRLSSIRWTGFIKAPQSGSYSFRFASENGYRVSVGEAPVVEEWDVGDAPSILSGKIDLVGGNTYAIKVEAWQRGQRGEQSLVWSRPSDDGSHAIEAARAADLVIFVGGLSARIEGEEMKLKADGFSGGDRTKLALPKPQEDLLEAVAAVGKPVVLVLMNGSAVAVNWADQHVPAIIEAWYPGGEGGNAVAQLIAGDYSPAGRLPVTFYRSEADLPDFTDYSMKGRTYRYFTGEVLYPFGYGLSYTRFAYAKGSWGDWTGGDHTVSADVTNTGAMDGDEVVQLYISHPDMEDQPARSLIGFQRIHLAAGETRTVTFQLDDRTLSTVDESGARAVRPGQVDLWIGGGQPYSRNGLPRPPGVRLSTVFSGKERALPK